MTTATLRIAHGGVLTAVQDLGRRAARRYGVPQSGAMDAAAFGIANRLVGNAPGAAALEITVGGTIVEVVRATLFAVTGGDLGALLDESPLPLWTTIFVRPGTRLRFTGRQGAWGARAYLAIAGGVAVPEVMGSRSTYLAGGFGGFAGRALRAGDLLESYTPTILGERHAGYVWPTILRPPYRAAPVLRVISGPHLDDFAEDALAALTAGSYRIGASSNRMGYRLDGKRVQFSRSVSLPSLGMLPGVIQVPPDGVPIVLMADAQTTGGYPIIATVIGPDLPLAAQLLPGDTVRFAVCSLDDALVARRGLEHALERRIEADESDIALGWAGG